MVQYPKALDSSLDALSDGTRRAILEHLGAGEATISELADSAGMSLTGVKKHVAILEAVGLVTTEKRGRTRHCRIGPARLDELSGWLEAYRLTWDERFDRLDDLLERRKGAAGGNAGAAPTSKQGDKRKEWS